MSDATSNPPSIPAEQTQASISSAPGASSRGGSSPLSATRGAPAGLITPAGASGAPDTATINPETKGAGDVLVATTSPAAASPLAAAAGVSDLLKIPIKVSVDPQGKVTISASGNGQDGPDGLNGRGTDPVRGMLPSFGRIMPESALRFGATFTQEILKPGYRTTEFWLIAWVVGLTLLEALLGQLPASQATLLSACIGGGYSLCRSGLKALRYIQSTDADQTRAIMESEQADREHALALEKLQ